MTYESSVTNPMLQTLLRNPGVRALSSLVGWFAYLLSFTLLVLCFVDVAAVGGRCASGNTAYVIQTQCPSGVDIFIPWVIFGMLLAALIGIVGAGGFGVPMVVWAWPILFCVLGLGFFFAGGGVVAIALGVMFEVMGVIPVIIELRGGIQRVFIGTTSLAGVQLRERDGATRGLTLRATPNGEGAVTPGLSSWILGPLLFWIGSLGGIYVALVWYSNVAS